MRESKEAGSGEVGRQGDEEAIPRKDAAGSKEARNWGRGEQGKQGGKQGSGDGEGRSRKTGKHESRETGKQVTGKKARMMMEEMQGCGEAEKQESGEVDT